MQEAQVTGYAMKVDMSEGNPDASPGHQELFCSGHRSLSRGRQMCVQWQHGNIKVGVHSNMRVCLWLVAIQARVVVRWSSGRILAQDALNSHDVSSQHPTRPRSSAAWGRSCCLPMGSSTDLRRGGVACMQSHAAESPYGCWILGTCHALPGSLRGMVPCVTSQYVILVGSALSLQF